MKDLRKYINKVLSESILKEDYASIKEIQEFAVDILLFTAKKEVESVIRQSKTEKGFQYMFSTRIIDVYQENPKKYPVLADFIINSRIRISFDKSRDNSVRGSYSASNTGVNYNRYKEKEITLYLDNNFFKQMTDAYKNEDVETADDYDLYSSLWRQVHSTLEHELQHAYDDFRSNTKLYNTKSAIKYSNKYEVPGFEDSEGLTDAEKDEKYKSYLKLQHEIVARFTQTINKLDFVTADFDKTPDGVDYLKSVMYPLNKVLKNFTLQFHGWPLMTEKVKRTLLRKVSAYWHKIQEGLDEENRNSIEKERIALNRRALSRELAEVRDFVRNTLTENIDNYKKWKRNNVMLRGITDNGATLDTANGSGAQFGRGLYMAPLSNKTLARQYGEVYYVVGGKPKNPKVFRSINEAEVWLQQNILFKDYKNVRDFEANTSIEAEMLKLGYDGIEIKGRETVNYKPENVKYYRNENQLMQHYEHYEKDNLSENLVEDYPSNFDMNEFKALKTFKERLDYCNAHLKRIGSDSSRVVYQIDEGKVLKLAKNKKGIIQNETEIDRGKDEYYSGILAKVFDSHPEGLWVEMERAIPINKYEFRRLTDFDIQDVAKYLINFQQESNSLKPSYHLQKPLVDRLENNEFINYLKNFISDTDALAGDLGRLSSYGIVKRDGEDQLVLIDFGLTDSDHEKLYRESINEDIIEEAPLRMESLPSTTGLFIMDKGVTIMMSLYDPESNRCYGYLTAADSMEGSNDYSVMSVAAEKGFGPFVYELAMMYVNAKGKGLMPSRDGDVRGDAFDVWTKFYDRKDVKKNKLTPDSPAFKFAILFDDSEMEDVDDVVEFYTELSKEDKRILSIFNSAYFLSPNDVFNTLIKNAYICKQKNADCQGMAMKQASKLWNEKYDE